MGELIVNGIKWAFIIGISTAFMSAISNFINLITIIVFGNVVGEIFGIMSVSLPFSASAVFSAVGTSISSILSFLIAKKLYNLYISLKP